ncbi:MAG: YidC/Oxa1 family membrane protein insertase [Dehalococcoidia bacterium]|nr:MAG: YidC/Oxa1 family membrane protein insertase [Dehalococcoidia bacterium]
MSASATQARPRPSMGNLLMISVIVTIVGAFVVLGFGPAWNMLLMRPLINALLLLTNLVGGQFGVAIILFTVLLRIVTIPFTLRQLQSTRAMQEIQPRMQEIQKKHKDPKRRQEETMKLYRESGVNPLGCFMPMAIQMLVFIALYRALAFVVGGSPESVVDLSQRIYSWTYLSQSIPLEQSFLWLELGQSDSTFILPLLVGVSTYVQTRLAATPAATPQQQQQQQMMTWMMPLVLVWITLALPSGVGVYWVVSNIFSVFASYWVYGRRLTWRSLLPTAAATEPKRPRPKVQPDVQEEAEASAPPEEREVRSRHGTRRGKRKKRR